MDSEPYRRITQEIVAQLSSHNTLFLLLSALADLVKWLDATNIPSMIIGGVAASVLDQPRQTQDVDALAILPEGEWANAVFH